MQVNILEAKNRLSELVRAAAAGEEVIIANRGKPVAKLVSAEMARTRGLPLLFKGNDFSQTDVIDARQV